MASASAAPASPGAAYDRHEARMAGLDPPAANVEAAARPAAPHEGRHRQSAGGARHVPRQLYRIHGSNEPDTIGQAVSSGCIRMTNDDVKDLYEQRDVGRGGGDEVIRSSARCFKRRSDLHRRREARRLQGAAVSCRGARAFPRVRSVRAMTRTHMAAPRAARRSLRTRHHLHTRLGDGPLRFRCVYCMTEDMRFLPKRDALARGDGAAVLRLSSGWTRKLRITGGEPLVRASIMTLFWSAVAPHSDGRLEELTRHHQRLATRPLRGKSCATRRCAVNVSLDTLRPRQIQGDHPLGRIRQGDERARRRRKRRPKVKINAVALKGVNEEERPMMVAGRTDEVTT